MLKIFARCKNCGHIYVKNNNSDFCSSYCAHSYSSKFAKGTKKCRCIKCGKELDIPKRASSKKFVCDNCKNSYKKKNNKCVICGKYNCTDEFCKKHNLQQLKSLVKHFNFDSSTIGTEKVKEEFYKLRNYLYDLYWNKKLSSIEICKITGYYNPTNLTGKIFRYLEIPRRTFSETTMLAISEGRLDLSNINVSTQYHTEYHKTWNGKTYFLRSSYETDFANELDKQHIDYEVENLRIEYLNSKDNKIHTAIPDFYVSSTNTIYEIKSNYTLDIQNMKDKFDAYKKLGYNCELVLDHNYIDLYKINQ